MQMSSNTVEGGALLPCRLDIGGALTDLVCQVLAAGNRWQHLRHAPLVILDILI